MTLRGTLTKLFGEIFNPVLIQRGIPTSVDELNYYPIKVGFPELLDRVHKNPKEYIVKDVSEGLKRMSTEEGIFMYMDHYRLIASLNRGIHYAGLELKLFGREQRLDYSFLLAKGSPYRLMLSQGSRQLVDSGAMETIMRTWRGRLPRISPDGLEVLGLRHLAMAFVGFAFVYGTSLLVLLAECVVKKKMKKKIAPIDKNCKLQKSRSFLKDKFAGIQSAK